MRGKDSGKTGAVIAIFPTEGRLSVEGANLWKKNSRPRKQGQKGEVVTVVRPLQASNVMLVCKNCKKVTRVGHRTEGNHNVRFCKKCQATL